MKTNQSLGDVLLPRLQALRLPFQQNIHNSIERKEPQDPVSYCGGGNAEQ